MDKRGSGALLSFLVGLFFIGLGYFFVIYMFEKAYPYVNATLPINSTTWHSIMSTGISTLRGWIYLLVILFIIYIMIAVFAEKRRPVYIAPLIIILITMIPSSATSAAWADSSWRVRQKVIISGAGDYVNVTIPKNPYTDFTNIAFRYNDTIVPSVYISKVTDSYAVFIIEYVNNAELCAYFTPQTYEYPAWSASDTWEDPFSDSSLSNWEKVLASATAQSVYIDGKYYLEIDQAPTGTSYVRSIRSFALKSIQFHLYFNGKPRVSYVELRLDSSETYSTSSGLAVRIENYGTYKQSIKIIEGGSVVKEEVLASSSSYYNIEKERSLTFNITWAEDGSSYTVYKDGSEYFSDSWTKPDKLYIFYAVKCGVDESGVHTILRSDYVKLSLLPPTIVEAEAGPLEYLARIVDEGGNLNTAEVRAVVYDATEKVLFNDTITDELIINSSAAKIALGEQEIRLKMIDRSSLDILHIPDDMVAVTLEIYDYANKYTAGDVLVVKYPLPGGSYAVVSAKELDTTLRATVYAWPYRKYAICLLGARENRTAGVYEFSSSTIQVALYPSPPASAFLYENITYSAAYSEGAVRVSINASGGADEINVKIYDTESGDLVYSDALSDTASASFVYVAEEKQYEIIINVVKGSKTYTGKAYVGGGVPQHSPAAGMPTFFEFLNTTLGPQVPNDLASVGIGNLAAYAIAMCVLFGLGTTLGIDIALFAADLSLMFLRMWMGHVTIVDSAISSMLVMGGLYAIARKRGGG